MKKGFLLLNLTIICNLLLSQNKIDSSFNKSFSSKLDELVVTGTLSGVTIKDSPVKVELISSEFLQKNPTNNLMEAIEYVNGLQQSVSCGVCGTNDIHINGLDGSYALILIDGNPIMGSLASVYGLNGIPTEMIERLEIIKGPSSTIYGTEAVSGVINIITKKPENLPFISINSFITSHLEKNIDFTFSPKIGEKWNTMLGANFYSMSNFMDYNEDNFSDLPLSQRISLFNKWSLKRRKDKIFTLSAKYYYEDRFGGTSEWKPEYRGTNIAYGESIFTDRKEVLGSYDFPLKEKVRLDFSYAEHNQNSVYGETQYLAYQKIVFSNLLWFKNINIKHKLTSGLSYRFQTYDDNTVATPSKDIRHIPGIFVQDDYKINEKTSALTGLRLDYQQNHGRIFSPRFSLKYKPYEYTTFRINSGTGFKVVNLFTEEHAAYTGSRQIIIKENLKPEEAYNVSINATHVADFLSGFLTLDADAFYTYFTNKIIPDYNSDNNLIIYENLQGFAVVKGFSFMATQDFKSPLHISMGATYLNTFEIEENQKKDILYVPNFSGVFNASYNFKKANFKIDYTGNLIGSMNLPNYPQPFTRPEKSPWYSIQNIQFTKKIGEKVEFYFAIKNLLNYTQKFSPIVDYQNPFSDNFDTSYNYATMQKRRALLGLRIKI